MSNDYRIVSDAQPMIVVDRKPGTTGATCFVYSKDGAEPAVVIASGLTASEARNLQCRYPKRQHGRVEWL